MDIKSNYFISESLEGRRTDSIIVEKWWYTRPGVTEYAGQITVVVEDVQQGR
jgi:hypothetical protein